MVVSMFIIFWNDKLYNVNREREGGGEIIIKDVNIVLIWVDIVVV